MLQQYLQTYSNQNQAANYFHFRAQPVPQFVAEVHTPETDGEGNQTDDDGRRDDRNQFIER